MLKQWLTIVILVFLISCGNYVSDGQNPQNADGSDSREDFISTGNGNLKSADSFEPYVNPYEGEPEEIFPKTGANDVITSSNVFLKGQYMEVGIAQCGVFGTSVTAPAGYHANTSNSGGTCSSNCYLGFVADPDKDGWNVGTPDFDGDFFLPGDPEEGFSIKYSGTTRGNYGKCSTLNQINQNVSVSKDYLCDKHIAVWQGTRGGLQVKQTVKFQHEGTYFTIEVELTNTNATTLNNVYYMRNVDPDNEILRTGNYDTKNTIVLQPNTDPEGKDRALVKAEGLTYNTFVGLAAVDARARVTHGGFANRDPETVWNGTGLYQTGTRTEDEAISLSFKIGNMAAGAKTTLKYAYILDATQVDTAFAELTGVLANGVDITEPLYFKICSLTPIDLEIKNHEAYENWTWSPSTYLDQSTGPHVVFNPPAGGNYVFDVTGTNTCAESVNFHFSLDIAVGDSTPPVIGVCPGNQNSTASALPDYRSLVSASDNCASNVRVTQNPVPGTDIGTSIGVNMVVDDFSGNSTSCNFTVTYTGPGTPVATAATNVGQTSATANWNAVGNATGYRLDVSNNAGFYSFEPGYENLNVGNVTNYNITGLNPGTTYYYRLRSVNADGTSSNSNVISFKTSAPTLQATNIVFSNVGLNQFDISWTRGDGAHNLVFIKQSDYGTPAPIDGTTYTADTVFGNGSQIGSTGWYCVYNGDGNSVSVTGLLENTEYIVKVVEYNGTSGSEYYQTDDATGNPAVRKTKATAVVTLGDLTHTYDGTQKSASAVTTPAGLTVYFTYTPDTRINAGSYAVMAIVNDANYEGSAGGTLVINKATPVILEWPSATDIVVGDTLADSTLSGGSANVSGTFSFTDPSTAPGAGAGNQSVTFTPADTDNYETVSGSISVFCNCLTGYTLNIDGHTCDDIDECDLNTDNCDANATCANTTGSFTCTCNSGYAGSGTVCSDINECVLNTDNCDTNATCTNIAGSFTCTCNSGYTGSGTTCSDIDECTLNTDNCDANATCGNTPGSFTCTCNGGYAGTGVTCSDIDECDLNTDNCDANATCGNTPGSFTCTCNSGYTGTGVTCSDIDECDLNTDNCDANATCANTTGSFTCTCNSGYTGTGVTCSDIDECDLNTDNCDANATCGNTPGSFTCTCNSGYAGTGTTCSDIDECTLNTDNCDANAACANTAGSFTCTCNSGYTGNGVTCSDINECDLNTDNCDANATCGNTAGSFTCTCNSGYAGTGVTCSDIDECDLNTDNCDTNATCGNIPGSFTCTCNEGYEGTGAVCSDINECDTANGGCAQNCNNTAGSYNCSCDAGYTLNGDGKACDDINECDLNTDNCDANATCANTPGSFTCTCNAGYTGTGTTCSDIDECDLNTDNCDANAACANTPGSFTCTCNSGYTGTGTTCSDIDECDLNTDNCDANATCANTAGSFTCTCNSGYEGTGVTCADINECDTANGGCAQNCNNTAGSYSCSCDAGYTLNVDGKACDDINECDTANGGCAQNCNNTAGSYNCSCDTGYTLNGDGKACDDIDECEINADNCDANATCANTTGSFTCDCNFGYDGNGVTCSDVDECADDTDGCDANAACANTAGGYDCTCNGGYEGDGYACSDIDECDLNSDNCDTNATCANTPGSFTCDCNFGYNGNGVTCSDVDECADNTDGCDTNASCANTAGGYDCSCNGGYEGDGYTCSDIDECSKAIDDCDANAVCSNNDGGFDCSCNEGFIGDGTVCTDVDECAEGTDNCDTNAACVNNDGGFSCSCNEGFGGDGTLCSDVDECTEETDNCDANATCANTEGGFECACNEGYTGDGVTCAEIPEGVCGKPEEITALPYVHNSTTAGRDSEITGYGMDCGAEEYASADYIYSLELSAGDKVEITLTPAEGFDGLFTITGICAEDEACLGYVNSGAAGVVETTVYEAAEDRTIFIVVEGTEGSTGDYILEVKEWIEEPDDDVTPDEDVDIVDDVDTGDTATDEDTGDTGDTGSDPDSVIDEDTGNTQPDIDETADEDSGDTGNTGNTGTDEDSGDTGDTGNTGTDEDSGDTDDTAADEDSTDSDETDVDENETQDDPYEGLKISGGGCSCGLVF